MSLQKPNLEQLTDPPQLLHILVGYYDQLVAQLRASDVAAGKEKKAPTASVEFSKFIASLHP